MLEESLDPRPSLDVALAALLAARPCEEVAAAAGNLARYWRYWDDRQNEWANLRTIRHWLERAG